MAEEGGKGVFVHRSGEEVATAVLWENTWGENLEARRTKC